MKNDNFPYQPEELSAFAETFGTYVISLKNGTVIKHDPQDTEIFRQWLTENKVRDINNGN